ncbi:MAG: hypothetical protein GY862_05815, partial [Gammaproteobacteria bacterium]|nr:hypothetical protein [Gammaproteobacteria bacterium]
MFYYNRLFYLMSGKIFRIHCRRFTPVFALAACLLLFPNAVNSDNAQWTSIGPYGGDIAGLEIDPFQPATLYVATGSAYGIFKSTDGAANWMPVNKGLTVVSAGRDVGVFVMDPRHPEILYLANNYGIYKTVDGAAHWRRVDSGLPFLHEPSLWIEPVTPSTLYAALHYDKVFSVFDLYKSVDSGNTWDQAVTDLSDLSGLPDPPYFFSKSFTSAGNTRMYGPNPVYRSIDEGPWIAVESEDIPLLSIDALAMDPGDPATVYAAVSIKATFTTPGEEKGIYKSTDSGAHWSVVNPGLPELKIRALAITPVSPATLYAGTSGYGIFKSTDGGQNWTAASRGMTGISECAVAMDPVNAGTMYVGTEKGLFKTVDRGASWLLITPEHAGPARVCGLATDPLDPAVLYAVKNGSSLYKSIDGGQSWTAIGSGLTGAIVTLAIAPVAPATLYLGAKTDEPAAGLFKSVDGGRVWTAVDADIPPDTVARDVAIDPADPAVVYASISADNSVSLGHGIFKSVDGGQTWRVVGEGMIGKIRIDPVTPANVYVGIIGSGVFKSGDGGENWAVLGSPVLENDWTQINSIRMDSANPFI